MPLFTMSTACAVMPPRMKLPVTPPSPFHHLANKLCRGEGRAAGTSLEREPFPDQAGAFNHGRRIRSHF